MKLHNDPMIPAPAVIEHVEVLTEKEKLFRIVFQDKSQRQQFSWRPGQFIELTVFGVGEAPISICSAPNGAGAFDLCVRAVGNVTNALHLLPQGAVVGVRGSYNRGFPIERMDGHDVVLVAGGLGLAPLRSLIQHIGRNRDEYGRVVILYGARSPEELLFTGEYDLWRREFGFDVRVTVDHGDPTWQGAVGVVTKLFDGLEIDVAHTYAAACGPPVMYKFVVDSLQRCGIPDDRIFLSFERRMECGIGKCMHCGLGSKLVCIDGPVFNLREVRDTKDALS
jgi:sulfhydrogenase subunit gamma (sulfur reductase)